MNGQCMERSLAFAAAVIAGLEKEREREQGEKRQHTITHAAKTTAVVAVGGWRPRRLSPATTVRAVTRSVNGRPRFSALFLSPDEL